MSKELNTTPAHVSGVTSSTPIREGRFFVDFSLDVSAIMNSPPPTTENSTTPAAANSQANYTPTPAIGNSPPPAIANLPTFTTENLTTPAAANSPANYTPTPAIDNLPPFAIANLPTSATENSTNSAIYCLCQQRCATKRCPCKRNRIQFGLIASQEKVARTLAL